METVDELVAKLHKPIYVLQMSRASSAPGAAKRAHNARVEIDDLVKQYVRSVGIMTYTEKEFAEWLGTADEG